MRQSAYALRVVVIVGRWWPWGVESRLDLLPIRHVNLAEIVALGKVKRQIGMHKLPAERMIEQRQLISAAFVSGRR